MQENEFEKSLQKKMDALQVQPAQEVWEKIRVQVAKKDDRKRRLVFFFLCCLLLCAGLFIADRGSFHTKRENIVADQHIPSDKGGQQANSDSKQNEQEQQGLNDTTIPVQNNIANTYVTEEEDPVTPGNTTTGNHNNHKAGILKRRTKASVKTNITQALPDENLNNTEGIAAVSKKNKTTIAEVTSNEINDEVTIQSEQKKEDPAEKNITKKEETKTGEATVAQIKKPAEKDKQQLWELSVSLSAGRSSTGNSYISDKSLASQFDNSGVGATPGGNTGNSGNNYIPSPTKSGYGFVAGIQVSRSVSGKTKIVTGLQYRLLCTSINTGYKLESAPGRTQSFGYGSTKTFTNSYHSISLPVSVSTNIFNIGQRVVNFDAGFNFSKLVGTNALSFNPSGYYYSDRSVFNNVIVGLSASAGINLAGKNKAAFIIGPDFYYSLTHLASSGMYSKSQYSFWGIRLQRNLMK